MFVINADLAKPSNDGQAGLATGLFDVSTPETNFQPNNMKKLFLTLLSGLSCVGISLAEPRTFTNKDGRTITAELIAVEGSSAVLKLANASNARVPLESLSEGDQEFVKSWREENKNKIRESDVRLLIDKVSKRMREPKDDDGNGIWNVGKKKVTKAEVRYTCVLRSYTAKDISDITVNYTIYKRVNTRGEEGSKSTTEAITGSTTLAALEGHGSASFETIAVVCEDMTEKGGRNSHSMTKRESVTGMVMSLSVNGEELFKQSHPENFIERLEADAKRQQVREE